MSYIDAYYDKKTERIHVVERDEKGKRVFNDFPVDYSFYYTDPKGKYQSIYGEPCTKFSTNSNKQFRRELNRLKNTGKIYESDIKPVFKILENHYKGLRAPKLNITFFDIEVDFDNDRGFAMPDDPFNKITAISLYNDWENTCYTLALAPKTIDEEKAVSICDEFDNTYLCQDEASLLEIFLDLIEDSDILSGWNSEGFDIPYVVGRTMKILGRDYAKKLSHWNLMPQMRKFERFGKEQITYDIFGRVHLDYLQLYRKYTYHEMHSYSLDAIGEYELNERKIAFEGSLDELYNYDFKKFIDYNRQDTMLLAKMDQKLKFISLANTLAHDNCVLLQTVLGVVGLTDQAIILEAHERGFVVPNRDKDESEDFTFDFDEEQTTQSDEEIIKILNGKIAGAYVATPKRGLSKWVGSIDVTSLYPSAIMALNISPETIVGQLDQSDTRQMLYDRMKSGLSFADAWANIFNVIEADRVFERKKKEEVTIVLEEAKKVKKKLTVNGRDAYQFIFQENNPFCLSANGTLFRYDITGIIPGLLDRWFTERKEMQGKARALKSELNEIKNKGEEPSEDLKNEQVFWDQRQLIKKIQLNSLYGAITNPGSRFYDERMGQSITLVGRNVAKHMAATVNEILAGDYDHQGECIIYGDTDSVYFSAWPIKEQLEENGFVFNEDSVVELYNSIGEAVNQTFTKFMINKFGCDEERAKKIKANREICAKAALFVKKKRYAALVFDDEGNRIPDGYLKIMGMDTQRADTPEFVQKFLKDVLRMALSDYEEDEVIDFIRKFRQKFRAMDPWLLGTPKRCNGLTYYSNLEDKFANSRLPGHIRAAYNWNKIKKAFGDNRSLNIPDGGKTVVCKLKNNPLRISSIAYPIDQAYLPEWFKELPFDVDAMEYTLIDKKLDNLIGVLDWPLQRSTLSAAVTDLFSFG